MPWWVGPTTLLADRWRWQQSLRKKEMKKRVQRSGKVSEGRASNTKKRKLIDLTACDILSSEELSLKSCSSVYQSHCIQTGITIENHHRQEFYVDGLIESNIVPGEERS